MIKWTCNVCGELHDPQFDSCWICGSERVVDPGKQSPTNQIPMMSSVPEVRSMWYSNIIENMRKKGTEELVEILNKRDADEWSEEAFSAAEEVLTARRHSIPFEESVSSHYEVMPTEVPDDPPERFSAQASPQLKEQAHAAINVEINLIEIFITKREQRTGPFTVQQIETMISSGMVDLSDKAWHEDLLDWMPLHQVLGVCPPPPRTDATTETPRATKPKSKESGIKLRCGICSKNLKAPPHEAGSVQTCPSCGNKLKIPHPGIGRCVFMLWKTVKFMGFGILAQGMGDGSFLLIPVTLGLSVVLAHQRSINIGHSPWLALLGLVPGSIFYLGAMREGAAVPKLAA